MSEADESRGQERASTRKVSWSDDIVTLRQEIDTLTLLYEEAAIEERLDPKAPAEQFLDAYRVTREAVRKEGRSPKPSLTETSQLTEQVALFGAQAAARVRHRSRNRAIVTCSCADRPAVMAELAEAIAGEGGNIEGGVMSVVGGHLVSVLLLSGMGESPQRIFNLADDLKVGFAPMQADDVDWPRPGSTCWHLSARYGGDAAGLLEVTKTIAELNLPLVTLSSWFEKSTQDESESIEMMDLNFAVGPDPAVRELETITRLEDTIERHLPGVQLSIGPVNWPTRYRPVGQTGKAGKREILVTAIGHAEPGFVNCVLRTIVESVEGVIEIRGSAMAILEGRTVLTAVLQRAKSSSVKDMSLQIRRRVAAALSENRAVAPSPGPRSDRAPEKEVPLQIVEAMGPDKEADKRAKKGVLDEPTHELTLQASERPRVVARVARLLANHRANITWFMCGVREPVVGERWPICEIQMHFHMKDKHFEAIDGRLRTMAEGEDWGPISLREWSLDS